MRAFGQSLCEGIQNADEGLVIACSGQVHQLTKFRGQLRVANPVEGFGNANGYLAARAELAAEVGMSFAFLAPAIGHVLVGFEGRLEGISCLFDVEIHKTIGPAILAEAKFFESLSASVLTSGSRV